MSSVSVSRRSGNVRFYATAICRHVVTMQGDVTDCTIFISCSEILQGRKQDGRNYGN